MTAAASALSGACGGARPEEAPPEAGPLLVGPVHEAEGYGTFLWGEGAHDFEGTHDVHALILGRAQTGLNAFGG